MPCSPGESPLPSANDRQTILPGGAEAPHDGRRRTAAQQGGRIMAQNGRSDAGPRCIAIVGPFQSGKTSLFEAILARTGMVERRGRVANGNTAGDAGAEARAHSMSVEPNVATVRFL